MKSVAAISALVATAAAAYSPGSYAPDAPQQPTNAGYVSSAAAGYSSSPAYVSPSATPYAPVGYSSSPAGSSPAGYAPSSSAPAGYSSPSAPAPYGSASTAAPYGSASSPVASPVKPAYTTQVVTAYTTFCPGPTSIVHGSKTYVVTSATTLTITNCPCTITKPVSSAVVTACATCAPGAPGYVSSKVGGGVAGSSAAAVAGSSQVGGGIAGSSAAAVAVSSTPVVYTSYATAAGYGSSASPVVYTSYAPVAAPVSTGGAASPAYPAGNATSAQGTSGVYPAGATYTGAAGKLTAAAGAAGAVVLAAVALL